MMFDDDIQLMKVILKYEKLSKHITIPSKPGHK